MPKYYVECGELRVVIDRDTPSFAALDALHKYGHKYELDDCVVITEGGFENQICPVFVITRVDIIMKKMGEIDENETD